MKKTVVALMGTMACAGAASAADLRMVTKAPPPAAPTMTWDVAFGGALMSDYNFRGISQSDRGPAVNAYLEPRWNPFPNLQLYAGIAGTSVKLATTPTAEIDFYAGFRPTIATFNFDFGFMYYYYPRENQYFGGGPFLAFTLTDTDYWEVYGKVTKNLFNDLVTVGANVYYSPDWLNTGAYGTYASGTVKLTGPSAWLWKDWGAYLSGELGHYWFGTTRADGNAYAVPTPLPEYTYWNVGAGLTYKALTFDVRYHDTDLSRGNCYLLTGDSRTVGAVDPVFNPGGLGSRLCGQAVVGKVSFDTTLNALK